MLPSPQEINWKKKKITVTVGYQLFESTWVESLDAKVISRLPLRPSKAGTRIKSSLTVSKTGQCCTMSKTSPAPTIPRPATRKGNKICKVMDQKDSSWWENSILSIISLSSSSFSMQTSSSESSSTKKNLGLRQISQ